MTQLSSESTPIDRYFQVSLYLLIATGFVTLASTGKLDAPALLLVSLALLYRGYLLVRGRTLQLPERWTSYATLVYAVFYVFDLFFLSGNFVLATAHLVLFIMVVKTFSVQRDRDHVYLAVIASLSVLAAALLTLDAVFLACFCVFLLLAVSTFVSMEMRRSSARAIAVSRTLLSRQRLTGSLSSTSLGLALGTALGSCLIFFLLPRLSAGYLSAYAPHNALVSGFSDEVRLGEIGQIQQSDTVVMHIQIDGDSRGAHDLLWRGVALRVFDGSRWSNPKQQAIALTNVDGSFDLSATRAATLATVPQRLLRYRVLMEPLGTDVFFLTPNPRSLSGNYRAITVDESGAVYNGEHRRPIGAYHAVSDIGQPSPDELRRAAAEVPPQIAFQYLQLPSLDPRLPQLAHEITAGAPTAYDKAHTVEDYLQKHYGYTLQLPSSLQGDPVAYFLFERKAGHCEYFASSMALMLRALGIPARVVNGFRSGDFNSVTGSYIVRARDAHSWVEAYFPRYGWITFDPTPAGAAAAPGTWNRAGLYLDALREFWREWVINYDFAHQVSLSNDVVTRSRSWLDVTRLWAHRRYAGLLQQAQHVEARLETRPRRFAGIALGVIALLALLLNLGRLRRMVWVRRLVRHPASAPQAAASIWYTRLLRSLGRRGWRKLPEQTPKEFVRTIADPTLRGSVAAFTDHYERARFGNSAQDAQALPEIYEEISKS
jgi:transglutaminase-like putative cysteine protease